MASYKTNIIVLQLTVKFLTSLYNNIWTLGKSGKKQWEIEKEKQNCNAHNVKQFLLTQTLSISNYCVKEKTENSNLFF